MADFPPYYKFNFGFALLGSSMTTSTTTMTIQGGSNFPYNTAAYFKVVIWNKTVYSTPSDDPQAEIVTAVWSGTANNFTVTRGDEGTLPSTHSIGDGIAAVVTAGLAQSMDTFSPRGGMTYTAFGTYNLILPYGISRIYTKMWGAGGCGGRRAFFSFGGSTGTLWGGGGGGAGCYCEATLDVSGSVQIIVGRGGITHENNGFAGAVNATNTQVIGSILTVTAFSGTNGSDAVSNGPPGTGGTFGISSNAIISVPGTSGTTGSTASGNVSTTSVGNAAGGISFGSSGGTPGCGGIGQGGTRDSTSPSTNGASGLVMIYW